MKAEISLELDELVERTAQRVVELLLPMLAKEKNTDGLMTIKELCEYLKVKQSWVYQQVYKDALPHCKVGNKLRFKMVEISKYIEENKQGLA
ncbi:MAG: helix-turn-helix domain-containing protein [Deltaproteobacteria bacterium]|nr:helix-turn-helix domain-containing protein [Deltaproteobacteria bacterium]